MRYRGRGKSPRTYYVRRMTRCNKQDCDKCPHGPYIYLRYRVGGKWCERYIGKG